MERIHFVSSKGKVYFRVDLLPTLEKTLGILQ